MIYCVFFALFLHEVGSYNYAAICVLLRNLSDLCSQILFLNSHINYLSCSLKRRWDLDTEIVLFSVATTAVKDSINGVERGARSTIR